MVTTLHTTIPTGLKYSCLASIRFLLNSEIGLHYYDETKIDTWRQAKRWAIEHTLGYELDNRVEKYRERKTSLRSIYSLISSLAILVSEQFDACLIGLIENDWKKFDDSFTAKKQEYMEENLDWEKHRLVISANMCRTLYELWISGWSYIDEPPVQELTDEEKRHYLEEIGELPKNPQPEDVFSIRKKYHTAYNRIHLSVDLFAPIEDITHLMKEIYSKKLEEYLKEIRETWSNSGYTEKFIEQQVQMERLTFDHKRYSKQEKKSQSTIDFRIRSLRYYYYDSIITSEPKEEKVFEALDRKKWWGIIRKTHDNKTKHMRLANKMIVAAIKGIPLQSILTY